MAYYMQPHGVGYYLKFSISVPYHTPYMTYYSTKLSSVWARAPFMWLQIALEPLPCHHAAIAHDRSKEFHSKFNRPAATKMIQLQNPLLRFHKTTKGNFSGEDFQISPTLFLMILTLWPKSCPILYSLYWKQNKTKKKFAWFYKTCQRRFTASYMKLY